MNRILPLCLLVGMTSCRRPDDGAHSAAPPRPAPALAVLGGVYALPDGEGTYTIAKVLALDGTAVHLRAYSETYKEIPHTIDTQKLTIGVGHMPLAPDGFVQSQPTLISTEAVRENELDGYRIYLDAMRQ
jgi:hypothetical protein